MNILIRDRADVQNVYFEINFSRTYYDNKIPPSCRNGNQFYIEIYHPTLRGNSRVYCLSIFDHFVGLALKGLTYFSRCYI